MSDINEVRERLDLALTIASLAGGVILRADDIRALLDDHERLQKKLAAAAKSLRAIADQAGRGEYMESMDEVRAYANSRACVAESALAVQP